MATVDTHWLLSLVGILVQLGVVTLVTALLLVLRREARRYQYFRFWTWGWVALTAAILVIALRHDLIPGLFTQAIQSRDRSILAPLHALYQTGKLLFLASVLLGAASFGRSAGLQPSQAAWTLAFAALYGLLTGALAPSLNAIMVWQAAVAIPVFAISAGLLQRAPVERRGHGVRVLVVVLLAHAAVWTLYLIGIAPAGPDAPAGGSGLALVTNHNSYLDAVLAFLLGLGTVLTVVEHTHFDSERSRKEQLERLERSERRLAEVLRAALDGIVTLDGARRVTALNPAAEQIFRTTTDRIRGEPFDRFVQAGPGNDLWRDLAIDTRRSEANPPVAVRRELTGVRADGTVFPMELAIASVGDDGARGYVIIARDLVDITAEREERERLQQQLAQAARLEAVGRMVSGVAHELNNPLTAILAFGQDMLSTARSEEDREALTVIVQQAQRCRVIVGDLLIFARNRRDERRRVAPAEVVQRVLRAFSRDEARHGVDLEVDIARDLPAIEIDVVGIEQVLTNLLTNAFQATPPGGRVSLRVRPRENRLLLLVEDTGPGIPPELLTRVFEPFFTTKDPGQGTGLGLAVSHTIVQQHGGTLTAENRTDRASGARFVVALPFVERRAASREEPVEEPVAPVSVAGQRKRKVLVVDDEAMIRVAVRRALERRGWEVDEAADGEEALLRLDVGGRPGDYDAVVTDLRMPGVSGIELCHRLEAEHPELARRLVVITGDTASTSVAAFLTEGSRPFLQKPFDMRVLADLLDRVAAGATDPA